MGPDTAVRVCASVVATGRAGGYDEARQNAAVHRVCRAMVDIVCTWCMVQHLHPVRRLHTCTCSRPDRLTDGWVGDGVTDGGMEGWKGGWGWVGARCGFPMQPQLGESDESFDVVPSHRPAYLIHTAAHLRMHVHFLHRPAPHLHMRLRLRLHLHLHLGLPAVSPVASTPRPKDPTTQRPPSRQPRGLLHCLAVHSRLQHCIFPDPHLSAASASSSRNGNASARGRRKPFLLSVSALALTLSQLFLPVSHTLSTLSLSLRSLEHPAVPCSLQSAVCICTLSCHVMPCHAVPCCINHLQHSTVHTYEYYVHT